jgi:hypothetical protein
MMQARTGYLLHLIVGRLFLRQECSAGFSQMGYVAALGLIPDSGKYLMFRRGRSATYPGQPTGLPLQTNADCPDLV